MPRKNSILSSIDWPLVLLYFVLIFLGWISVYGASYDYDNTNIFSFDHRAGKQLVWMGCALFLATIVLLINAELYDVLAYFIYGAVLLLLILTIFIAPDIKGSRSWLVLGPIRFQPAEIAKFATVLALAKYMSQYEFSLQGLRSYIPILLIIFIPILLIICQKETGSALVFFSFFLMLYRKGMPGVLLYLAFCAVFLFIVVIRFGNIYLQEGEVGSEGLFFAQIFIYVSQFGFFLFLMKDWSSVKILLQMGLFVVFVAIITNLFVVVDYNYFGYFLLMCTSVFCFWNAIKNRKWTYILIAFFAIGTIGYSFTADYLFDRILQPHQQSRIKVLLGMEDDLSGAGYNVNQSKIAIGSGGFFGKGFLNGTQTKLDYVPEQDTDFIFCTVGEEWGFLGTVFVLTLYLIFICRIVVIAERQKRVFAQIYAYCVASIFLFHMFINVGMVIGLCPVIGIPLPFFSYGGSSLWGFTILTFVLLRLDAARYN